eukprot:7848995-Alexandrium_andersonii.AAC.1
MPTTAQHITVDMPRARHMLESRGAGRRLSMNTSAHAGVPGRSRAVADAHPPKRALARVPHTPPPPHYSDARGPPSTTSAPYARSPFLHLRERSPATMMPSTPLPSTAWKCTKRWVNKKVTANMMLKPAWACTSLWVIMK